MSSLFLILSVLCILALIVGLIMPRAVIRWGKKRTRGRVFLIYGLSTIIFFILFIFAPLLTPQSPPTTKQEKPEPAQQQNLFGLSEGERKEVWEELLLTERRAREEADLQYPANPAHSLKVGQLIELSKKTPLMPELEPTDATAALGKVRDLSPKTTIKVLKIATKKNTPWYFVEATNLGTTGWINSIVLIGQTQVDTSQYFEEQSELFNSLADKYKEELAKKYELTEDQLQKISIEGINKSW